MYNRASLGLKKKIVTNLLHIFIIGTFLGILRVFFSSDSKRFIWELRFLHATCYSKIWIRLRNHYHLYRNYNRNTTEVGRSKHLFDHSETMEFLEFPNDIRVTFMDITTNKILIKFKNMLVKKTSIILTNSFAQKFYSLIPNIWM